MDFIKTELTEVENLKKEHKYDKAIEKLENMLSRHSEDYRIYEELADIYLYLGQKDKALKAVDFSLQLNSGSATWNYLKGFILLSENKIKRSVSYLEKSNKLIPNNSEVLRNLGWAYNLDMQIERAIYVLKRALNISPSDVLIIEDLAMALIGAGEIEEGNKLLESIWKPKKTFNV